MHKAFISYSHAADGQFAPKLEAALQQFAKPWYKMRAIDVFRDATNLNLSPHLWETIVTALENSEYFLVLASPEAAASKWVQREIEFWLHKKDRKKLLLIVTGGDIAWIDEARDFDWQVSTALPRALAGAFEDEPLYLDLRWVKNEQDLSPQHPQFIQAVAVLSATLRNKSVEDMIGEEARQHRRTVRLRNAAIGTLSTLLIGTVFAAAIALQQKSEAVRQRDVARATASLNQLRNDLNRDALLNAVQVAWASHRKFGLQSRDLQGLTLQGWYEVASHPTAVLSTIREPVGAQTKVAFAPNGDQILSVSSNTSHSKDATIRDWQGTVLNRLPQIYDAEYSPDGTRLIVGWPAAPAGHPNPDGSMCGNVVSGIAVAFEARSPLGTQLAMKDALGIRRPRYSADGKIMRILCGNYVHLSDANGVHRHSLNVPDVVAAEFSPDGSKLLASTKDSSVLFDLEGNRLVTFAGARPSFMANGRAIVTELDTATSVLWDLSGKEMRRYKGGQPQPGPEGLVLTLSGDASLLWRPDAEEPVRFKGVEPRLPSDAQWVMTTVDKDRTKIWDLAGNELTELDGISAQFSPWSSVVMTTSASGITRLWELTRMPLTTSAAAARLWRMDEHELENLRVTDESRSGSRESPDGSVRISVYKTGVTPGVAFQAQLTLEEIPRIDSGIPNASETPPVARGPSSREIKPECRDVKHLDFSRAESRRFLLACGDGNLYVYDLGGQLLRHWRHDNTPVNLAIFSRDGRAVLSALADGSAILRNILSGEVMSTYPTHESEVVSAFFSPSESQVASITSHGVLRLWTQEGQLLATFSVPNARIEAATFSHDGTRLLARVSDRTSRLSYRQWIVDIDTLLKEYAWIEQLVSRQAGRAFANHGKLDDAMAAYYKQGEVTPDDGSPYNNRGNARSEQDDLVGAIADYEPLIFPTKFFLRIGAPILISQCLGP